MATNINGLTRVLLLGSAVALIIAPRSGFSQQSSRIGESCDLAVFGITETKNFLAFDRDLRNALSKQDAGALALLVRFPLRINGDRGSWYVSEARSLQLRFEEVFPVAVRDAVLAKQAQEIACNYRGIMYGLGTVWVNPQVEKGPAKVGVRYLVEVVNLPDSNTAASTPMRGRIEFVGETSKHRIIVDIGASGFPRYRAWNKPRGLTEKPDLEIDKGSEDSQGSGPCGYSVWTFISGETKYVVQELGCYPDSNQPPSGAKGKLNVSGKSEATWWCF